MTNHSGGKICKLLKNMNTRIHEIIKVKMQYFEKKLIVLAITRSGS